MSNRYRYLKYASMPEKDRQRFIELFGKMMLCLAERDSLDDMAKTLDLEPWQVDYNFDELLYLLRKHLGWKRYIKALFI